MQHVNIFRSLVGRYFFVLSILPIFLLSFMGVKYCSSMLVKVKKDDMKHLLKNATHQMYEMLYLTTDGEIIFKEIDDALYIGSEKITDNYKIVDKIKENNGIDATIFYEDMRVSTTVLNEDGSRLINTSASDVWNNYVSKGKDYFTSSIEIDNKDYYGYYEPIIDVNGKSVGMLFSGIRADDIDSTLAKVANKITVTAILFCLAAVLLAIILYNKLIRVQNATLDYLEKLDAGILNNTPDSKLMKRQDEYGMMYRYFVKINDNISNLIQKDALMGIYNRRAAMQRLEQYIVEANSVDGTGFCLAIGDIDFFKKVNDTYGHSCGDEVLKMVAEKLDKISDDGGFVARWGGEEFLVAVKGKRKDVEKKLRKLFDEIKATSVSYEDKTVSITMTFGLTEYIPPMKLDVLISNADILLYKGKNNGRNQIVL